MDQAGMSTALVLAAWVLVSLRAHRAPRRGFHSCIRDGAFECWCIGTHREIVRPERLVCTLALADRDGNEVAAATVGHDPRWPSETLLTVAFDDQDGKTRLTLRQNVAESLAKQTGAYPSWLEMLERLEQLLREPGLSLQRLA